MYKLLLIALLFGSCFAQDSTAIQLKINEQIELGNAIEKQAELDLAKISYAIFVLDEMLKPSEEETDEKDTN